MKRALWNDGGRFARRWARPFDAAAWIALPLIGLCAALAVLFCIHVPPEYDYVIERVGGAASAQAVEVTLTVRAPLLCRLNSLSLYMGDGEKRLVSVHGADGAAPAPSQDGYLTVPIRRSGVVTIRYRAALAIPGKHGLRGQSAGAFLTFDGGQVLLVPRSYLEENGYLWDRGPVRFAMGAEEGFFDVAPTPPPTQSAPDWARLRQLMDDAFVVGALEEWPLQGDNRLRLFRVAGDTRVGEETARGVRRLFDYYRALFGTSGPAYTVVLLPEGEGGVPVIGGAGRGSVAATFDPDAPRDWALLAHRMFHAFFDDRYEGAAYHTPENTVLLEGYASYYENLALTALPPGLQTRLEIDVRQAFASLYARYLYMRTKDPFRYAFAPADEAARGSPGRVEFTDYTAAPLLIWALEERARAQGRSVDETLGMLSMTGNNPADRALWPRVAAALLGEKEGVDFWRAYVQGDALLALWTLSDHVPEGARLADVLNEMESTLASWYVQEEPGYKADLIEYVPAMRAAPDGETLAFLSLDVSQKIKAYSPTLYAFLSDYFRRVQEAGLTLDSPSIRS